MHDLFFQIIAVVIVAFVTAQLVATLIAKANFPLPPATRRIGCVDGLRGFLAISVLASHFIVWIDLTFLSKNWDKPDIYLFRQFGSGAVALFFMTTGLIFYPRVLAGLRRNVWREIYITRFFRIVPMVILSVTVVAIIAAMRTGQLPDGSFPLAFLSWITTWDEPDLFGYPYSGRINAFVLWSLWCEWLFYIFVLPACAFAMDLTRDKLPSWTVPLGLLILALIAKIPVKVFNLKADMVGYLPLFAVGMLAYECQLRPSINALLQTTGAGIVAVAALAIGMTAFPSPYSFALPLFCCFFVCVACGNSIGGLLQTKGALVLGECSYGIYLLHGICLNLFFVDIIALFGPLSLQSVFILVPLIVSAVILVTAVTYLLCERPGIRMGKRFARIWRRPFADTLHKSQTGAALNSGDAQSTP